MVPAGESACVRREGPCSTAIPTSFLTIKVKDGFVDCHYGTKRAFEDCVAMERILGGAATHDETAN